MVMDTDMAMENTDTADIIVMENIGNMENTVNMASITRKRSRR